jgi:hypothetical protein
MKRVSYLTLAAAAGLISSTALAKSVSFDFRVHSYGSALYPCDAGIQHLGQPGDFLTANYKTVATPPASYLSATGFDSSVTLPSRTDAADEMKTVAYPLGFPNTDDVTDKFTTVLQNLGNTVLPGVTDPGLHFFLASDNYGAQYFVDFCYAGPQIPASIGNYPWSLNYNLSTNVTHVALLPVVPDTEPPKPTYLDNAAVKVSSLIVCDDTVGDSWYSTSITDDFTDGILSGLNGVAPTAGTPDNRLIFDGSAITNTTMIENKTKTFTVNNTFARHCVIRYIFNETATADRANIDGEHAQFRIDLSLSPSFDPVED